MKLQKLRKSQDSQGPSRKDIKAVNNCWRDETLQTSELPVSPAEISKDTAFVSRHPRWSGLYRDAPVRNLSLMVLSGVTLTVTVHQDRLVSFVIEFLWSFIGNPSVINRCLFMFPQEKLHHSSLKAMSNSWINIKILEPTKFQTQWASVKESGGCCFFLRTGCLSQPPPQFLFCRYGKYTPIQEVPG